LKILLIFIFSCWVFFFHFGFFNSCFGVCNFNYSFYFCFVCVGKGKLILCVLNNCSNKCQCHMWVGLLVKWWTMNQIGINVHIGKNCFFQVAHFIKHSKMGCAVHPPHVMIKLKSDENIVYLIWASKVCYAMGLGDV
jgi:hypothetical protein